MNPNPETLGAWTAWMALALVVLVLGAYVALDLSKRLHTTRPEVAVRWLVAAGLCLGTGLWSLAIVAISAQPLTFPIGYHPGASLAAWGLAGAISTVALALAGGRAIALPRIALGACVLGLGVPLGQMAVLAAIGLRPDLDWNWSLLAAAAVTAIIGGGAALALFFALRRRFERGARLWHATAAAMLGVSALLSQHLVIGAAGLAHKTFSAYDRLVSSSALTVLASVGSLALLAVTLYWSVRETRMSATLHSARNDLRKQALRDPLTGLPNRVVFEGALAQAVRNADATKGRLALLFINLDGFKPINESFGHHVGDRVLRDVAKRLRALAGPHDRLARLGADEFLLLRTNSPASDAAAHLAGEVLEKLCQPCEIDGRDVTITASLGVAMYPEHGAMSKLVAHADAAMRAAKSTGGATYSFFEARMINGAREERALLGDLRVALAKGQFELYYQPKIDAASGAITGVEALMRWHHPQRGMVSPAVFIPIAERFGLIHTLGNWVIDEACRQVGAWREEGLRKMRVAINLSVHQLRQTDLIERIGAALALNRIKPEQLTCEITESVAREDVEGTMNLLGALAAVGVHISIDDFGTGYSSLSLLRKLPATELKIDRSFVLDLETSEDARTLVKAIVKMAQALRLQVVAEGVETKTQDEYLRSIGCDQLQGYYFGKPMSAKALALWATQDEGPRSLLFRDSLFRDTAPIAVH